MRPKFIVSALGLLLILLAWLHFERPEAGGRAAVKRAIQPHDISNQTVTEPKPDASSASNASPDPESNMAEANARDSTGESLAEPKQTEIEARASQLMELAMNNDSASLDAILAELWNPTRAIRTAALQAAVQFGSRDAIPRLTDAASQAEDPDEKAEILQAIEFLKLPSLSEIMAETGR